MKRLFAFMLVLAMVLSLSVSAFAAGNDGTITITNATKDDSYNLYHIFDATYSVGTDGQADSVVYKIDKDTNQFFAYLFGADGTATNPYFIYDAEEGTVTKKDDAGDKAIIDYLTAMVRSETDGVPNFTAKETKTASDKIVKFEGLPYGYYLIDKGNGAAVTIDSNTPDVEVIDKNQKPDDGSFNKLVYDEDTKTWVESSTASVGEMIDWKINFMATNYDGDKVVKYYTVTDEKSSSLWVEFDDIEVTVGGVELKNGYYYCANNDIATGEWEYLGEWTSGDPSQADWYLIHYTYDRFEIVIPWLDDYTFTGKQDPNQGYELKFDLDETDNNEIYSESIYGSPVEVVVTYSAAVGPTAAGTTAKNSAKLEWTTAEGESGPEDPQVTETKVYNMGVTKIANDGTATTPATRLAGAIFELYTDSACTNPVYVIPTNNEGVYILDDYKTEITGTNRVTSREEYAGYWEAYIGSDTTKQKAEMTTPANGQLVIMGLEAGTYYLKEIQPPVGYNKLPSAVEVKVGPEGTTATYSDSGYKDKEGKAIEYTVSKIDVVNSKGVELPSTGGKGTMMLITFGSMVAMAFAVLLITHKKMSIYED